MSNPFPEPSEPDPPAPSDPSPPAYAPSSNLGVLLNGLSITNSQAIDTFGAGIGLLADVGGAIGIVGSVVTTVQMVSSWFNSQPDPLQPVLDQLQKDFTQLFNLVEAQHLETEGQTLAQLVGKAEADFQTVQALLSSSSIGSVSDFEKRSNISDCLAPLDTLSDTTAVPVIGPFFLAPYVADDAWTDAGQHMQASYMQDADNEWILTRPVDTGFGTRGPTPTEDNQVFSHTYSLPYYLKAVFILNFVGVSFYPDFGTRYAAALSTFVTFLSGIHDTIVGAIQPLLAAPPGPDGWLIGPDAVIPGMTLDIALSADDSVPTVFGVTFAYGAVEIYSGTSSVSSAGFMYGDASLPDDATIYRKLQLRALGASIKVYAKVGLDGVSDAIDNLNRISGAPVGPRPRFKQWSLRDAMATAGIAPRTDGAFHLSDLYQFLVYTPPFDVDPSNAASLLAVLAA
jgi:hypothetical protein